MPRPHVLAVVAMSLDGKIATRDRESASFSSNADRRHLNALRAEADALVAGAGTIRASDTPMRVSPRSLLKGRPEPARAVVSRLCLLSPDLKVFGPGPRALVFTTGVASPGARKALDGAAELIMARGMHVTAREIVETLAERGVRRIQVEGGGELIWTFAEEGLLDEMHVTVCPALIGGRTAPSPAGGEGFSPEEIRGATLAGFRRAGDEVYLKYVFPPRR
jgi:riboflavin-specific deaminase-like protein